VSRGYIDIPERRLGRVGGEKDRSDIDLGGNMKKFCGGMYKVVIPRMLGEPSEYASGAQIFWSLSGRRGRLPGLPWGRGIGWWSPKGLQGRLGRVRDNSERGRKMLKEGHSGGRLGQLHAEREGKGKERGRLRSSEKETRAGRGIRNRVLNKGRVRGGV